MLSEEFYKVNGNIRKTIYSDYFNEINKYRIKYIAKKENSMIAKALKENKNLTDEDRKEFEYIFKSNKESIEWIKNKKHEKR